MKHETYKNVTIMDHPLIIHKISKMRDVATSSKEFREYVNEIATLMGYEVTRDLPLVDAKIQTPLEVADVKLIGGKKLADDHQADVNTDAEFKADTDVVDGGEFQESKFRSAPYFDVRIDGITLLNEKF